MAVKGFIILLILGLIGFYSEKRIIVNPVTVFCGLWSVILFFSSLGYYTMYPAKEDTYTMILSGAIFYVIGYYANKILLNRVHVKIGKHSRIYKDKHYNFVPRYRLLYGVLALCLVFAIYDLVNIVYQNGFRSMGMTQAFLQSGEYENNYNSIMGAISVLVVSPTGFALPAIVAVDFWFGKRDKKLLIGTIIFTIVKMLSSANRTTFIMLFIYLILTAIIYLYHNNKYLINARGIKQRSILRIKGLIFVIGFLGIIAFVLMTMSRGSQLFRNLYLNFAMPPRMFEIWAETIEDNSVIGYGMTSLLGFVYPVCYFVKNLFGFETIPLFVQNIFDWTMLTDSKWVWPGQNILANAYVSVFWFFFTDGRWFGILLGMFIWGIVVSRNYQNILAERYSVRQIALYCLMFYGILFSFVRLQFTLYKYALAILFVMFIAYKEFPKERRKRKA